MNNTINIYFKNGERGSISSPESPGGEISPSPEESTAGQQSKNSMSGAGAVGLYVLKQSVSYAISNIGEWTGNSNLQKQINGATKIVGYGTAIAVNPVMGSVGLAMDLITQEIDYYMKMSKEQDTLGILNRRAGNVNRSR